MQLSQKETRKNCVSFFRRDFLKKAGYFFEKKWQFLKVKQFEKNVCSWAAGNSTYDLNICNPHFF